MRVDRAKEAVIEAFCDSDWAYDKVQRKSTTDVVVMWAWGVHHQLLEDTRLYSDIICRSRALCIMLWRGRGVMYQVLAVRDAGENRAGAAHNV